MTVIAPIISTGARGIDASTEAIIIELLNEYAAKLPGNREKQLYYEQKNIFKDFKISTPPQLRGVEAVLGWAAKPVDVLSDRIQFEKFTAPGVESDPFDLNAIAEDNNFADEFSQATTSALTNSLSFATVTQGLEGEPDVLWLFRSADEASGLWDRRRRGLKAGLTLLNHEDGVPTQFAVYLPGETIELTRSRNGGWSAIRFPSVPGRCLIERLAYKPTLRKPMGQSRITRAVRSLTDAALRTIVRSEVGAEFFAAPQRYGIGIDGEDLDRWKAVTGRLWTVTMDQDMDKQPTLGQFPQHSMQPHIEHLRQWASLLSGESGIPLSELGFVSDNPESEGAIKSQRDPMRLAANSYIRGAKSTLRSLIASTVMLRDGLSEPPAELREVSAKFAETVESTETARADAIVKQLSVLPWLADSPVILERLGYEKQDVDRLMADRRSALLRERVQQYATRQPVTSTSSEG